MAVLLGAGGLAAALGMLRWNHARVERCARRATHHGAAKAVGLAGAGLAGLGVEPALANGNAPPPAKVASGLEVLLRDRCRLLQGRKVGIVTNPTAVDCSLHHAVDLLHEQLGSGLVCVFGPEHGFRGTAQAGDSERGGCDASTGLPVYDLYRLQGGALEERIRGTGIDTLVFDIQDVGTRFYTYVWLLYECMLAAAALGVTVVVLDRPNPVGGLTVEGPVLQPGFESDVGRQPIAQRHAMTVGELAGLFNLEFVAPQLGSLCELEVVRMQGWRRDMMFADTGLPWVPPSPNMPTPATALVYAGTGLFEGTNVSEGRGSCTPFELVGAPWMDRKLAERMRAMAAAGTTRGVAFREAYFTPTFSKHQGASVAGVQLHVWDSARFEAVRTALALLTAIKALYSHKFEWRSPSGGRYFVDLLSGGSQLRQLVDAGGSVDEAIALWQKELVWFRSLRERHLLY